MRCLDLHQTDCYSFTGLFPLLLSGALLLVKVEEISQTSDSEDLTIQNCIQFSGPLPTTSLITNTKFEVCRSKRVIKLEGGVIRTPQPTDSIIVLENVEFFGQRIDLTLQRYNNLGSKHCLIGHRDHLQPATP
ncbi:hypothetical protein MLD38_021502 [Melastoma candidum]|uniref:Uncharacterized protein n=1 Tax=Melastoma candidum TaxID=119954 RepID=A0ACB9QH76_9MYRT|nr:hypothetical protein MLD38_040862 [Melastoma candidum]KAI4294978.1 hypothetical protein MLD38_040737 [Melastoma candidum]KAI4294986.1 hypothetical protein MLD38_040736 [Melastoma candidum]KAI4365523.1 hypothetical protein MLD38_021502 [Melastoma candidum]